MLELGDNKIRKVSYASLVDPERSKPQYPTLESQSNPIPIHVVLQLSLNLDHALSGLV